MPSEPSTIQPEQSTPVRSTIPVEIGDDSCNSCLDFISSDETLDRYSEIISASGWKLDNYLRNPVFQNAHQYGDILFTLGRALITEVRSGGSSNTPSLRHSTTPYLFQRIEFACDINPMAKIAYGLYKGKFLNAVSVGFVPLRWEDGSPESSSSSSSSSVRGSPLPIGLGEGSGVRAAFRRRYLEQELLEVSAVGIPANPNALALGLKSGAIEKSDLRDLSDLLHLTLDKSTRPTSPTSPTRPIPDLVRLARDLHTVLRS